MKKSIILLFIFLLVFTGCANGPIRYKLLGHKKYATYELTKRSHIAIKPVAAPSGVVIDASVICLDTCANIILGLPITLSHGGPDASGGKGAAAIVFLPFWYPFTVAAMGIWPKKMNEELFGEETGFFQDSKKLDYIDDNLMTGNLQEFLIDKFHSYSYQTLNSCNTIIPNNISWKFKTTVEGFRINVVGDYYEEINNLLNELYGSKSEVIKNKSMTTYFIDSDIIVKCTYFVEDEKPFVSIVTIKKKSK